MSFALHAPALRCPECGHDGLVVAAGRLGCLACGMDHGPDDGVPDLAPHVPSPPVEAAPSPVAVWTDQVLKQRAVQLATGLTYELEADWVRTRCRPVDGPIVELACGGGREARVLASLFGGDRVLATDLDPHALRRARHASVGTQIAFLRADATRLPIADGVAGAVDCFGALHLVDDPVAVLREAGRVARAGASLTGLTVLRSSRRLLGALTGGLDEATLRRGCEEGRFVGLELRHHGPMVLFAATRG